MENESPITTFRRRLREVREARRWSQQDLSRQLDQLGYRLDKTSIARLEGGQRDVSLMEVIHIAHVLGVAPIHLFVPTENDVRVELPAHSDHSDRLILTPNQMRRWVRGDEPLVSQPAQFFDFHGTGLQLELALRVPALGDIVNTTYWLVKAYEDGDASGVSRAIEEIWHAAQRLHRYSSGATKGLREAEREFWKGLDVQGRDEPEGEDVPELNKEA